MTYLLLALLTLAALAALLLPLWRRTSTRPTRGACDAAVYRDQLAEIDRDVERGLLSTEQAAAVRVEVQRRLLAALDGAEPAVIAAAPRRWATILPIVILLPAAAAALYLSLGRPQAADHPFASRQSDPEFQMSAMADRLARSLAAEPSADGFATLAATYTHLKRYGEAADAYRKAIRMGAIDGDILASLGEVLVLADDGTVGPEAKQAFQHALMTDRADPRARFYLGLADAQMGRFPEAVSIWRDLERDSAADAPWLGMLREHISEYAKMAAIDPAKIAPLSPAPAGNANPVGDQAAAVMAQSPEEQARTIRSMVDGLAARLAQNPEDKQGWLRLANAYRVLGETDKAKAAADHAAAQP